MTQDLDFVPPERTASAAYITSVIFALMLSFGLFLASRYSYLLFHTTAELFSVIIAVCVFLITWNSRHKINNNYLLLLGISYLFVSGLDFMHALAYKGMGIIKWYDDDNLPPQLWLVSRYVEAISLIIAPTLISRRLNILATLSIYASITGIALLSIFYWEIFPTCFIKGVGLTPFKKNSEYIISIMLVVAMIMLYKNREKFDSKVQRYLILSILATIATELSFTFYIHLYGISNLIGHYFKIIAYFLIYKAIIETCLLKPYDLLFRELQQANKKLSILANTDSLTGVYNRLGFMQILNQEIGRVERYGNSFSLVLLDVDHFKLINDRYGHNMGDEALRQIARLCESAIRRNDVFARWGGEEFILMLPCTLLKDAAEFSEKLRVAITGLQLSCGSTITCSLGVTTFLTADSVETLVNRADKALYCAKNEGRNRVCLKDQ